jgi:mediator of RNA polymerase II transcription subunit 14
MMCAIIKFQVRYLENLIQSRLAANETLDSLYATLHSFCQALQLEVLQNQTQKLCMQRLGEYVRIEEYRPGRCLTVSYWRELMRKTNETKPANLLDLGYRFSIQVDPHDGFKPLSVIHMPPLTLKVSLTD